MPVVASHVTPELIIEIIERMGAGAMSEPFDDGHNALSIGEMLTGWSHLEVTQKRILRSVLEEFGINDRYRGRDGYGTLLHDAVALGTPGYVHLLLCLGADPSVEFEILERRETGAIWRAAVYKSKAMGRSAPITHLTTSEILHARIQVATPPGGERIQGLVRAATARKQMADLVEQS